MESPPVELTVAIMTVAGREHALDRVLAAITPLEAVIVIDEARSRDTWTQYRRCLTEGDLGTHRLVLQDDALPVEGFAERALAAIAERPNRLVCLYTPALPAYFGRAMLTAANSGHAWCELAVRGMFTPLVATVWPAGAARSCVEWKGHSRGNPMRADDARVQDWLKATKKYATASVPCLVDHDEELPSALANGGRYSRRAAILPSTPAVGSLATV